MQRFKKFVGDMFADRAGKWSKVDDYLITSVIILSTIEVLLSTHSGFGPLMVKVLDVINTATVVFFTIEVSLRIWTISDVEPRYKGRRGKLRYCFSFWGFIDIIATYPHYLSLFLPIPVAVTNSLKVLRIFRIFRFTPSFQIVVEAFRSKKSEMSISLQLLAIVTVILSLIMYYVESGVQPDKCKDGMTPIIWSFMQYIGDPGGFADFKPVTFVGRVMASLIGVLGIAIFAVPAGLLGSAFVDVIERRNKQDELDEFKDKIISNFRSRKCRVTNYFHVPKYQSLRYIQAMTNISEQDLFDTVESSDRLRISNLAVTISEELNPTDKLVVEYFPKNRSYGACIDRNSSITIVCPVAARECSMGHFTYNLAKIGGFNYVSKEWEVDRQNPNSYYNIGITPGMGRCPNLDDFLSDISALSEGEDKWVIVVIGSSGGVEPIFDEDFHFLYGSKIGNDTYEGQEMSICDTESFENMYQELSQTLREKYGRESDKQKYHNLLDGNMCWQYCDAEKNTNAFVLRVAYSVTCWDKGSLEIATVMADSFNKHFEVMKQKGLDLSAMKARGGGYDL